MVQISTRVMPDVLQKAKEFVTTLQTKGLRVDSAFLFGSHAKGHPRSDSDIDVAVVSQDLSGDWLDDFCYLTRIADDIDARMEVIPFRPQDFRDENPLVWEIKTTGIPLLRKRKNDKRSTARKRGPVRKLKRASRTN